MLVECSRTELCMHQLVFYAMARRWNPPVKEVSSLLLIIRQKNCSVNETSALFQRPLFLNAKNDKAVALEKCHSFENENKFVIVLLQPLLKAAWVSREVARAPSRSNFRLPRLACSPKRFPFLWPFWRPLKAVERPKRSASNSRDPKDFNDI